MFGGDGDDDIRGDDADDDLYGGYGDDQIEGGEDDDDIWAGPGNDYVTGDDGSDVIRGEAGDDILLGGSRPSGRADDRDDEPEYDYIYGGEGDDAVFGQNDAEKQFLWGGEGADYLRGGGTSDEMTIFGGDGDDFIRPSGNHETATIHGGKGDDIINEVVFDEEQGLFGIRRRYDRADGVVFRVTGDEAPFRSRYGDSGTTDEAFYGQQGDDKIWAGGAVEGEVLVKGGTGDDHVYGGYETVGDTWLYGNAGKDVIRSDWYRTNGKPDTLNTGNEYLFGDYKYGEDALDKDLWGDDDIIYGGYGDQENRQTIYGGDGSDEIHVGYAWRHAKTYGQTGDDTIYAPQDTRRTNFIYGGEGNDKVLAAAYGDVPNNRRNNRDYFFGGAGDDEIHGTHKAQQQFLYGGDGDDKVYGGDAAARDGDFQVIAGNAGDDWLQGGDNLRSDVYMYGDNVANPDDFNNYGDYGGQYDYLTDRGDDVMYGGDNGAGDQYLIGGYGNDTIIAGNGVQGNYVLAYGDQKEATLNPYVLPDGSTWSRLRGAPDDGDDLIQMGDHPDI